MKWRTPHSMRSDPAKSLQKWARFWVYSYFSYYISWRILLFKLSQWILPTASFSWNLLLTPITWRPPQLTEVKIKMFAFNCKSYISCRVWLAYESGIKVYQVRVAVIVFPISWKLFPPWLCWEVNIYFFNRRNYYSWYLCSFCKISASSEEKKKFLKTQGGVRFEVFFMGKLEPLPPFSIADSCA